MLLIYVLIPSPSVLALLLLFCRGVGAVRVFVCVCVSVCAQGGSAGSGLTPSLTVIYCDSTTRQIPAPTTPLMYVKRAPNYQPDGSIDGPFQPVT